VRRKIACEVRHPRLWERTRSDDDLIRHERLVIEFDLEPAVASAPQRTSWNAELDRKVEPGGVRVQVRDRLVPARVAVRITRERHPRQGVIPAWREEFQRVPALAPGGRDVVRALQDYEVAAAPGEEVADGHAGLAAADDDDVVVIGRGHSDLRVGDSCVGGPAPRRGVNIADWGMARQLLAMRASSAPRRAATT